MVNVTFEEWANVMAHCKCDKIKSRDQADCAARFGIQATTWHAANKYWSQQMHDEPRLVAALHQIERNVKKQQEHETPSNS